MATEALLPIGAAYTGATQSAIDSAKAAAGADYFPTVFDPSTVHRKGHAVVGVGRAGLGKSLDGFKLYYEVHGSGPIKVAFVMGLNNTCFGWLPQVEHLAKDARYSCLVFDNRGVGNTETPAGWYTTSGMAEDTFELLEYLDWIPAGGADQSRTVHVAGVSMGGMIALEMARQRPAVLKSLTLISTTPGRRFRTPTYGVTSLVRVLGGRVFGFDSEQYRLNRLITTLFPQSWLSQPSRQDPQRTNQQVLYDMFKWRFHFTTRQSLHGAVSQMKAALTHHIPDAALAQIDASVPKIAILTGDEDYLVDPRNSEYLSSRLATAQLVKFDKAGHALGNQLAGEVNRVLEEVIREGEERSQGGA